MKYCNVCGAQMEDTAQFCPDCGTNAAQEERTEVQSYWKRGASVDGGPDEKTEEKLVDYTYKPVHDTPKSIESAPDTGEEHLPKPNSLNENRFAGIFIISVLIILDVFLVPFYSFKNGLLPADTGAFGAVSFWDAMGEMFHGEPMSDALLVDLIALVPAIAILIGAALKKKGCCKGFSLAAAILMAIFVLLTLTMKHLGPSYLFGAQSSITIGFWIALVLHIASMVISLRMKE